MPRTSLLRSVLAVAIVTALSVFLRTGDLRAGDAVVGSTAPLWSLVPLRVAPSVPGGPGGGHPIDAFLAASREARGLEPLAPASRSRLLRRVFIDLVGLPPTPAELEAFLSDDAPDAYERVVDRLLEDPQHGVRYARHWLDVLRYADVDGNMPAEAGIYLWRDWVIAALNRDLPYDQFVRLQIAGDRVDSETADRFATGFLARAAHREGHSNHEIAFAAVDTISSAFLGMTVACARCHDHFYDPIKQSEYYAMKALFDPLVLEKEVLADSAEKTAHEQEVVRWNAKQKALQSRLEEISDLYYPALFEERLKILPPEVAAVYRKPAEERSKEEQRLADDYAPVVRIDARKFRDVMKPEETARYEKIRDQLVKLRRDPPMLAAFWTVREDSERRGKKSHILEQGNPSKRLAEVAPGFPFREEQAGLLEEPREGFLRWLTAPANPLFARVAANRIWQWHFGQGLVRTSSDFGSIGARPAHPELLDWLAVEFVRSGYSMKKLHRLIVTSRAYRCDSSGPPAVVRRGDRSDPSNEHYWKFPLRRLAAETVWDLVLSVAGTLDLSVGGKSFRAVSQMRRSKSKRVIGNYAGGSNRRGIYMGRGHHTSVEMMPYFLRVFDAEDGQDPCPQRRTTVTAPQVLYLLNSELTDRASRDMAEGLRRRSGDDLSAAVEYGYKLALSRTPTEFELSEALRFLDGDPQRLAVFCWSLMNLSEFLYVG